MVNKTGIKHQGTRVALQKNELDAVLALAKAASARDYAMFLVTVGHGLRASELCGLRPEDLKNGYLTIRRGKGGESAVHKITDEERRALEPFAKNPPKRKKSSVEARGATPLPVTLFGINRQQFHSLFKWYAQELKLSPDKQMPHCLRHTTVKRLLAKRVPLEAVQKFVGHVSLASTGFYAKVDNDEAVEACLGKVTE